MESTEWLEKRYFNYCVGSHSIVTSLFFFIITQYLCIPNLTSYRICHRDYLVYFSEPTVLSPYVCGFVSFYVLASYWYTIIYFFNLSCCGLLNFISNCCLHGPSETTTNTVTGDYFLTRAEVF